MNIDTGTGKSDRSNESEKKEEELKKIIKCCRKKETDLSNHDENGGD